MKVQPATHHGQENARHSRPRTAFNRGMDFWHQSQIGHRSEYSVERLLAFKDYCRRTSLTRVVAVCILTPIPAIVVTLLIDCTPLRPPSEGWRANYAFWIRWFLALIAVSAGATAQIRELISPGTITNTGAVVIVLATSIVDVSAALLVAALWQFPIPFGYIIMVGPYLVFLLSFTLVMVGRQSLAASAILREQLKSQATIVCAQGLVAMAYPFFTAVFYQLSGPEQTAFVVVMPVFKHITKHVIAHAAEGLHECVGPIVVFSVDVFNVFYLAMCMQISKSMVATLLIIASDSFHVIAALRDIFQQTNAIQSRPDQQLPTGNYLEDLAALVQTIFEGVQPSSYSTGLRIAAPCPLPLSDDSSSFLDKISRFSTHSQTLTPSSAHTAGPILNVRAMMRATEINALGAMNLHIPQTRQRSRSAPGVRYGRDLSRQGSSFRGFILMSPAIASDALRSSGSRAEAIETVRDALQALFHAEYLLTTEYIECALPLLYAGYLTILYHLPVATYYPQTASSNPRKLSNDVVNILSFSAVELAGFIGLVYFLRRKFGISPLYQLAFVLETQIRTVQGLFVWTVFILHMPLMHYGTQAPLPRY